MSGVDFWIKEVIDIQSLMREYAPRMAQLHAYKMSENGLAIFADWCEEQGEQEAADLIRSDDRIRRYFTEELLERFGSSLSPAWFPNMRRVDEYRVGWTEPLLFGSCRVHVGPIADARIGSDAFADYKSEASAVSALKRWDGVSSPPQQGLIRFQLRGCRLQKANE